jgi:hypothetical protein
MGLGAIGTLKEWRKPFKYENALKVCRDGAEAIPEIKQGWRHGNRNSLNIFLVQLLPNHLEKLIWSK